MRTTKLVAAPVAIAVSLMLAACGNDPGGGSSATLTQPPAQTLRAAPTTIEPLNAGEAGPTESVEAPAPPDNSDPVQNSTDSTGNPLSFDTIGWSYVPDTPKDLFRWGGAVTNTSPSEAYGSVWMTILFLDGQGRVLVEDGDWLEYIGPGQTVGIGQQRKEGIPEGVVEAKPVIDSFDSVDTSDPFPVIEVTEVEAPNGLNGLHDITGWIRNETASQFEVNQLLFLLLDEQQNVLASVRRDDTFTLLPQSETFMAVTDFDPWPDGVVSIVGYVQEADRM